MTRQPAQCLAAIAVLGLATIAGCGRSDADVARLRHTLETALAAAPLPPDDRLDTARATFDRGCNGFVECADGDARDAVYAVPLQLTATAPHDQAGACRYFTDALRAHGMRLITVWRGTRASYATTSTPRAPYSGVRPRWIDVTDQVCATGHVDSAVMVNSDGSSPAGAAHLVLSLDTPDAASGPRYLAIADARSLGRDPATTTTESLPVDSPPLARSELAYLRALLDQEFVIAANPAQDGVDTGHEASGEWSIPPGVSALHFRVTCLAGDDAGITLTDIAPASPSRPTGRTVACSGQPIEIDLAPPAATVRVGISVHEHPASPSTVPRPVNRPYTVQAAPVRTSG